MRRVLLAAAVLCFACKDKPAAPAAPDAGHAPLAEKPAPIVLDGGKAALADGGGDAAPRGAVDLPPDGKVGVQACDDYLEKMSKCIAKLAPEAQETMRTAMEDSRRAWRDTAATAEGKAALATACAQALDAAKSAAQAMGCEW